MSLRFLTLFFFLFCSWISTAQRYPFKNYTLEEGLVNNETYAILQDHNNRIWVTSTGGVSCFNGTSFTNYTADDGLASNICFSVFEDSKGRIWVGTLNNGVSIIEKGKITNPKGLDFASLGSANAFLEGKDGMIYIFFSQAIASYKEGKLSILSKTYENGEPLTIEKATWFDDNTIYLVSTKNGISKMTLNPLKIENIYNGGNGINNICYSVIVDKEKNVWVGGYGELDKITNGKLTKYTFDPEDFDKNRVYDIYEDNENELYLTFEGNGFGIFNKNTGNLKIINEKQGLPSKFIYKIIKDTEGNFWMTSYGEGLIRFRDTSFKIYDDTQGLPSNSVTDVVVWDGDWAAATDKGVVSLKEGKVDETLLKNIPIKTLFVTPHDHLLVATNEKVVILSKDNPPKLIDKGVYPLIYKDKKRTFLFGTDYIKVLEKDSIYDVRSRRCLTIKPLGDRYVLGKIGSMLQLKGTKIDTIPGLNPYIHSDFRSLDNINENELIAGSEKKLYHITLKDSIFNVNSFDLKRFKNLKHFKALKIDGNNLWLGGRDIFCKVNLKLLLEKDSIVATYYKTIKHFLKNDIDLNSIVIDNNKTLLTTSLDGLIAFNEKEYKPNIKSPKLDIKNIELFSEPFNDSLYRTPNGIVLPYQKNYLSFTMEAITFTNPENVHYKFRMKGLRDGDTWSKPLLQNNVVFSYLPPGSYSFEFTADNGDGVWQEVPYTYTFTIKVPIWRTWQFWFASLFISAFLIVIGFYYKNKKDEKRRELFTQNLINAQEEERTRVARELHDSVGQKLMLLTKKTKNLGNLEMENLAGNTLEELRSISRGLHPATLERLGPSAAIKAMIDEVDGNTEIFFTHDIENIDALLSKEASLHLYRIIQEVLNNMVKHADAKAATVTIEKKKDSIEAIIEDNGKGFEYNEKLKSSSSLGMKTLMERAKILHSKIEIKSQINKGTTITLIIPT